MMDVKPKKHLGQHFLTDEKISERISNAISKSKKINLLEIGPGTGALTKFLLHDNINLISYELDTESIVYLKNAYPTLIVHNEDVLKTDWTNIFKGNYSVTGNFPYNISSQILFKIYENRTIIEEMVGMFQKEVAERVCSGPGTKKYGILSVLIQAYYDVEYLFTVNEEVFNPPPKVKSGVIKISRNNTIKLGCDEKLFFRVVKAIFNQRRKMARNSLKSLLGDKKIDHVLLTKRPEELSIENFIEITKMIESKIN
jgi:16S rRNA (adenine1518-N6/adenine1519-N6)-dimethyltransferase